MPQGHYDRKPRGPYIPRHCDFCGEEDITKFYHKARVCRACLRDYTRGMPSVMNPRKRPPKIAEIRESKLRRTDREIKMQQYLDMAREDK